MRPSKFRLGIVPSYRFYGTITPNFHTLVYYIVQQKRFLLLLNFPLYPPI